MLITYEHASQFLLPSKIPVFAPLPSIKIHQFSNRKQLAKKEILQII